MVDGLAAYISEAIDLGDEVILSPKSSASTIQGEVIDYSETYIILGVSAAVKANEEALNKWKADNNGYTIQESAYRISDLSSITKLITPSKAP